MIPDERPGGSGCGLSDCLAPGGNGCGLSEFVVPGGNACLMRTRFVLTLSWSVWNLDLLVSVPATRVAASVADEFVNVGLIACDGAAEATPIKTPNSDTMASALCDRFAARILKTAMLSSLAR